MKFILSLLFAVTILSGCAQTEKVKTAENTLKPSAKISLSDYTFDASGVTEYVKLGQYSIEKSIIGYYDVNTYEPASSDLVKYLKSVNGIEAAYNEKRYSMVVYVGKMHQFRAMEIISEALDSFYKLEKQKKQ